MNSSLLLQGLLPLIVFAIVDTFASFKWAIIAALVLAVGELVWSYASFGEVDQLTWISLGLILVMGAVSLKMNSDRLFKFQPVVLALIVAAFLAYFQWTGQPLLVQMVPKVSKLLPPENAGILTNPKVIESLARLDFMLIFASILHGTLVAWTAMRSSTLIWLLSRGLGFYFFMGIAILINLIWTKFYD